MSGVNVTRLAEEVPLGNVHIPLLAMLTRFSRTRCHSFSRSSDVCRLRDSDGFALEMNS